MEDFDQQEREWREAVYNNFQGYLEVKDIRFGDYNADEIMDYSNIDIWTASK